MSFSHLIRWWLLLKFGHWFLWNAINSNGLRIGKYSITFWLQCIQSITHWDGNDNVSIEIKQIEMTYKVFSPSLSLSPSFSLPHIRLFRLFPPFKLWHELLSDLLHCCLRNMFNRTIWVISPLANHIWGNSLCKEKVEENCINIINGPLFGLLFFHLCASMKHFWSMDFLILCYGLWLCLAIPGLAVCCTHKHTIRLFSLLFTFCSS